jgi:hypothetical protein
MIFFFTPAYRGEKTPMKFRNTEVLYMTNNAVNGEHSAHRHSCESQQEDARDVQLPLPRTFLYHLSSQFG